MKRKKPVVLLLGALALCSSLIISACQSPASQPAGGEDSSDVTPATSEAINPSSEAGNDSSDNQGSSEQTPIEQKFAVSFNPNGGSGSMNDVNDVSGAFPLPQCAFTAPEGYEFDAWEVNGVRKNPGESVDITRNTIIKALWKALPVDTLIHLKRYMSSDLDSEYYDEYFEQNASSCLYGGMLLSTQTPNTYVDLTLDPETSTYKLEKDAFMYSNGVGGTHADTDGFEFYLTFEGEYVANEDGTYELKVPTKATRYWFIVQLFAGYFDQMGAMIGLNIPGYAKPSDYITVEPIYGTTQAVDADNNPVWAKDDAGHELYEDAEGNKYYKIVTVVEEVETTTWYNADGTPVSEGFDASALTQIPEYAIDSYKPTPTDLTTDPTIVDYWFNGLYVTRSNSAMPQIVTVGANGVIESISSKEAERANIKVDGINREVTVLLNGVEEKASYDANYAFDAEHPNFVFSGNNRNRNFSYTANGITYSTGNISNANLANINVFQVNNVVSANGMIVANTGDAATFTVNGTMSLSGGVSLDWIVKDNKLNSLKVNSDILNKSVNVSASNQNGKITIKFVNNGREFSLLVNEGDFLNAAFAKFPECQKTHVSAASIVIDRVNKAIKGLVAGTSFNVPYTVEEGNVVINDTKAAYAGGKFTYKDGDLYTEMNVSANLFTDEGGVAIVNAADEDGVSANPFYFTLVNGTLSGQAGGMIPLNTTYTLDGSSLVIADTTFVVSIDGGVATISYVFSMPSYGINLNCVAKVNFADLSAAAFTPAP